MIIINNATVIGQINTNPDTTKSIAKRINTNNAKINNVNIYIPPFFASTQTLIM